MNQFKRKLSSGGTLLLLALVFVAGVLLVNQIFRGWRIDLTANNQYTLSDGTLEIIDSIDQSAVLLFR